MADGRGASEKQRNRVVTEDFAAWVKRGDDGWTVLHDSDCIKLKHNATKKVFTVKRIDELYFGVWAISPNVDGPKAPGNLILKIHGLRNALLAIGFLKQR